MTTLLNLSLQTFALRKCKQRERGTEQNKIPDNNDQSDRINIFQTKNEKG